MTISSKRWDAYLARMLATGMPSAQIENFVRTGYLPQPKQCAFHALCRQCDEPGGPTEVAFGGARGPGKSHALLAQMGLDDCQRAPGLKCLLLRRVGKAVRESFEDLRISVLRHTLHEYNRSSGTLLFPNESRVILGHYKDERDVDNYLGLQYDVIGVEEATTLTQQKVKIVRTCNRTSRQDWRPRMYYNSNPGGLGHSWFKRRFVSEPGQPRFVAATYLDNAFLDASYGAKLSDLTGWLRRAWMLGDWNVMAGQYFSTWRPKVHVVEPFNLQQGGYTFSMSMDYGFVHPSVALVFAQANNGDVYVVAEYGASKRLPETHSKGLHAMLGRVGIHRDLLRSLVIGADAFRKRDDGKCVADEYSRLGWPLESAIMSRIPGATEILRRLGEPPGIRPSLYIWDTCPRLIEQLPTMQHDPKRVEDCLKTDVGEDGYGGDDYYDTLRYGLQELVPAGQLEFGVLSVPR